MTLLYELDLVIPKIYLQNQNEVSRLRLSEVTALQTENTALCDF